MQIERVLILALDWLFLNGLLEYLRWCMENFDEVGMFVRYGLRKWLTFFRNWRVEIPFLRKLRFVAQVMAKLKADLGFVKLGE